MPAIAQRIFNVATAYIVATVESECTEKYLPDGSRWWDTRPLFNEHEHCNAVIDINRELLDLGLELQILGRHRDPALAHLVHINATAK